MMSSLPQPTEWRVLFYVEDSGSSPVEEFILRQDERTQARLRWGIEQVRARNISAREPLVKHVEGKLYELRIDSGGAAYRIIYFTFSGRRIILLHGFQKKTQKMPNREIAMARARMRRFVEREGGPL